MYSGLFRNTTPRGIQKSIHFYFCILSNQCNVKLRQTIVFRWSVYKTCVFMNKDRKSDGALLDSLEIRCLTATGVNENRLDT